MIIYVDGQVVELDCKIYEPFPEVDKDKDGEG